MNNTETITTPAGRFMVEQRNAGFVVNDGQWIVFQLPDLYWHTSGALHSRRPGSFLGVFADHTDALAAVNAAEALPVDDDLVV